MATSTVVNQAKSPIRREGYPADSWLFDISIAILGVILVFGLYLDGWAHNHGMVDDSFFTIWHAALYGSFGLLGISLVGSHFYNTMRGYAWTKALPRGYMPAVIAVFFFALGGLADMGWHIAFGIETDTEALLSPSHLLLAVSIFFLFSAPFSAAWQRKGQPKAWYEYLPILLSAAMILSIISFFLQFLALTEATRSLIGFRQGEWWWMEGAAIAAIILNTNTIAGLLLFMSRRWTLPFGSATLIIGLNNLLMIWMNESNPLEYLYFGGTLVACGLVIDFLLLWLKPTPNKVWTYRVLGAAVPFIIALALMGALHYLGLAEGNRGLWWKIHMWLGTPVLNGLLGLLLSFLVYPPAIPQE